MFKRSWQPCFDCGVPSNMRYKQRCMRCYKRFLYALKHPIEKKYRIPSGGYVK